LLDEPEALLGIGEGQRLWSSGPLLQTRLADMPIHLTQVLEYLLFARPQLGSQFRREHAGLRAHAQLIPRNLHVDA
jgi:hypothetical protein